MLTLIFTTGTAVLLLISGFLKILSFRELEGLGLKLTFLPVKVAKILGYTFPFIEILLSICLILQVNNIYVNFIGVSVICVFILLNVKAIFEHNSSECFCFGNLLKSKMGYGGLVQSFLLLISLIPNMVIRNSEYESIFDLYTQSSVFNIVLAAVLVWSITLILIRSTLDELLK